MNRERNLTGSNGYEREIGFAPLDFLKGRDQCRLQRSPSTDVHRRLKEASDRFSTNV
jgi:hypothetical protein